MLDKDNFELLDDIMSNFDGVIDREIEKQLREGNCYAGYPTWNFHGSVWFEDNQFYCEIKQYRMLVDTIHADTLEEIKEIASSDYGWD